MAILFRWLVGNMREIGTLKKANLYSGDFMTMEFERDGKVYTLSITCDKEKESKENA